jgi:hypothetical protein
VKRVGWSHLIALAHEWWPDVFIAACDPVNPTLLVLALRALRHFRRPAAYRPSYDGGPMRRSSLTVTI